MAMEENEKLMRDMVGYYLSPCPKCHLANLHYEPDSMNCFCRICGHKTSAYELSSPTRGLDFGGKHWFESNTRS